MKSSQRYLVSVLALGWIVLVVCSMTLFWARWVTWSTFTEGMELREQAYHSGLVPEEIKGDPNVSVQSRVRASCRLGNCRTPSGGLLESGTEGLEDDQPRVALDRLSAKEGEPLLTYWDRRSGLIVRRMITETQGPGRLAVQEDLYAGPQGISDRPGKELGRFTGPIVVYPWWTYPRTWRGIVYDTNSRHFFRIDWDNKEVLKGPAIAQDIRPIQVGAPKKNTRAMTGLSWSPPMRRSGDSDVVFGESPVPIDATMEAGFAATDIMVLTDDGQIYRLDAGSLALSTSPVGCLPRVGPRFSSIPSDLLAYDVLPVRTHGEYAGCVVAAVGADGTVMEIRAYDRDGRLVLPSGNHILSSRFHGSPGSLGVLASQYLLECLHPVSLSLLSRAIGPKIEALAGHRGLLVLPNSFIVTRALVQDYPIDRLFWTVVMLLPPIGLAAFLAWRVARDATTIGLSRTATRWWIVGIAAFGPPAYITYRLTRPQVSLVTCTNCGHLRRPDMDRCHRCHAPWVMPDLTAPAWRVMDRVAPP